jgi:hypothetical protein
MMVLTYFFYNNGHRWGDMEVWLTWTSSEFLITYEDCLNLYLL